MSDENVEIVRRLYDAFNRGDVNATLDCFHPDVVIDASHRVDGRVGHGREEMLAIFSEWMETWEDWREQVEEIRDAGDRVLVISTQRGRGKGSGVDWEQGFGMLYDFLGNRIGRWTIYDDPSAALEAAGLSRDTAMEVPEAYFEATRKLLDAWSRRDAEAIVAMVHEGFEWHPALTAGGFEGTTYRGPDDMRRYLAELDEVWTELTFDYESRHLAPGNRVVQLGRFRAIGKESGVPVDHPQAVLVEFRGDRAIAAWGFQSHEEALEAAGLSS